jgi:prepilin-type N-terminal cleavage/methylation domain-containing protein
MKPRRQSKNIADGRSSGFTLLEVMVAMLIFAMAIGVTGATIARRDLTPKPAQVAKQMQALLFRARSEAILKGRDTVFSIHTGARQYSYPVDATPVALPQTHDINVGAGAELTAEGGEVLLVFRADGSSSGAEITLSDGVSADARISVNWLTGVPLLKLGASG